MLPILFYTKEEVKVGLFSSAVREQIDQIAAKSTEAPQSTSTTNTRSMNDDLNQMSKQVIEYFKDSPAILISSKRELHEYVDKCIEKGYAGIDTETTGLDRINDWVVGASLYTPGQPECYIPMKHLVPIFDTPYKNQLSYEDVGEEFQRLVDNKVKLIFANADYDLAMIYKDLKVDMIPAFYYDVISAWRCLKENELDNSLKGLYAKYPMRGKVDPKKFSDFFSPKLFPYCKPEVAKLYAANDAKITYDLFVWQLPFVTATNEKCKKNHLEKIANLVWNIEFPMVAVCALLHRRGVYLDDSIAYSLHKRYENGLHNDEKQLAQLVQALIDEKDVATNRKRPFRTGADFNPNSQPHVKYLLMNLMGRNVAKADKATLKEVNQPATDAVLKVRGDVKLIGTYVDKLPKITGPDHRVHSSFKALGAATGRMCLATGTKITILHGSKSIEDIVPGDIVYCYDNEGNLHLSPVKHLWKTGEDKTCVSVEWGQKMNERLICTPDHPILKTDGSWCKAANLKVGDELAYLDRSEDYKGQIQLRQYNSGVISEENMIKCSLLHAYDEDLANSTYKKHNGVAIQSITPKVTSVKPAGKHDVYDIEVDTYHNFIAEGICVHNSSDSPNLQNIPSKAHDIRHLFRATPESTEHIKLDCDDNTVNITLSKYDSVRNENNDLVKVHALKESDKVLMKEGTETVICKIVKINDTNGDPGRSDIVLETI